MVSSEVARRYASGLFQLALEKKMLDRVAEEMEAIGKVCRHDRILLDFLAAPQIRDQEKEAVLRAVFKGRVSEPVEMFIELIVRKRRSRFLIEIAEAFNDLVLESKGVVKTHIESAVALSEKERTALKAKLEKKTGKKILIDYRVRPEILGGVIVHLDHQVIDNSVRHQLLLLRDRLLELKVH